MTSHSKRSTKGDRELAPQGTLSAHRLRKKFTIFVSSPGDVHGERAIIARVTARLNKESRFSDHVELRTLMYEHDAPAAMGSPAQTIIDEHMRSDRCDLMICVLWHRMGTPMVHPTTGITYESGTEYEFETAFEAHTTSGKPDILLYRCTAPVPQEADPEQWMRVRSFFKNIEDQHRGLYKAYNSREEFEALVSRDIELCLRKILPAVRHDLRDMPTGPELCGRQDEIAELEGWITQDQCRVVGLIGGGGVGKTTLAAHLVDRIKDQFEYVLWHRLVSAPTLEELARDCVRFISGKQSSDLPTSLEGQLEILVQYLSAYRCLLVLDNLETILLPGTPAGQQYRVGFEGYGKLIRYLGELSHKSCLLLTSRELPDEVARLNGHNSPVRSKPIVGLAVDESRQLLQDKDVFGSQDAWDRLVHLYAGNPLALKIVSERIRVPFGGDIGRFVQEEAGMVPVGVHNLLEEQCNRLTELEIELLYWLAIERESASLDILMDGSTRHDSRADILQAIGSLNRRSLIEVGADTQFFLQPVILEHLTERIVTQATREILEGRIGLMGSHALLQATARDYVRETQKRVIVAPILENISNAPGRVRTERRLRRLLEQQRRLKHRAARYAAGNIINLLLQIGADIRGADLSHLPIWQADLSHADLYDVNLAYADVRRTAFTDNFDIILSVAFSPTDDILAAGTATGEVRLWKISDGTQVATFRGHTDFVWALTFSPDGRHLISGSEDKTVRIWERATGRCPHVISGHQTHIRAVACSPDGELVVTGGADQYVHFWDRKSGVEHGEPLQHPHWIKSLAFSADGRLLATAGDSPDIYIWEVATKRLLRTLPGDKIKVRSVAFGTSGDGSDNTLLVSGGEDSCVRLWDVATGNLLQTMEGHGSWVRSVVFSSNGRFVASGSDDRTIRVWTLANVPRSEAAVIYGEHTNWLWSIAVSPDGRTIASAADDQTARLWDTTSGKTLHTLRGHNSRVMAASFSPDGAYLASGGEDMLVRVWDVNARSVVATFTGHTNRIRTVSYHPSGRLIASGGDERMVRLWEASSGKLHAILEQPDWVKSVTFTSDGDLVAVAGDDSALQVWRVSGQHYRSLVGHRGRIWAVAASPTGDWLATGGDDSIIRLWDIRKGALIAKLAGHTNRVRSLAFSPDGTYLVSGSEDLTVRVWNPWDNTRHTILTGHTGRVRSVVVLPDGRYIASASEDQSIRLWDVQTGSVEAVLSGHTHMIWTVTHSSNGNTIASGSEDGAIKLWDTLSRSEIAALAVERPYERLNIDHTTGLTEAQRATLMALGAIDSGKQ